MKKKRKVLSLTIILLFLVSVVTWQAGLKDSIFNTANKAEYKEITEQDYETQSDNVKFMAYFLDGDKQLNGSSNRIGYSDTLYFNLKLTSGTLRNAKIQINSDNFYLDSNLMEDSVIASDYISKNTKEISLKEISGNIDKTFSGDIKSGDYEFPTSVAEAIGNDISKYSKENTIFFSAEYVNGDEVTQIEKTITITVDWFGTTNIEIPNRVYGKDNLIQKYNIDNYLDAENGEMTLEFNIATQETTNEVLLKKSYIEGTIPLINDIAPTNVTIEGENVSYTYDDQTRKFTATREAILAEDGVTVDQEAYSGTYAQNEISYRYNEYTVKVTYPIDTYLTDDDQYLSIDIPVNAYYEGFNGERSEQATATINVTYSNMDNTNTGFRTYIGRNVLYPVERLVVSKNNILLSYSYSSNNPNSRAIEAEYYTRWNILTRQEEQVDAVTLTDNKTQDIFVTNTGSEISTDSYIHNKGIAFSNPLSALGENGWISVYNDDTGELIHTFTKDDWSNYDMLNPYEYENEVAHIRVETSTVNENSLLTVYNVKSFDTEKIRQDFTQEVINNITKIKTNFKGSMKIGEQTTEHTAQEEAYFEDEISVVNFHTSKSEINTQTSNYLQMEINPVVSQYNSSRWMNESYLIKLPEDIINLTINNITTDNEANIKVEDYYQYSENGNIFIKINISGEGYMSYSLLVDCIVETDPTLASKTADVELYAFNNENNNFYSTEQTKDVYDIDSDSDTEELIGKKVDTISIVQDNALLTYQSTSDATPENQTIYAPLTAIVETSDRTATVDITLQNNNQNSVKDIKVLGT